MDINREYAQQAANEYGLAQTIYTYSVDGHMFLSHREASWFIFSHHRIPELGGNVQLFLTVLPENYFN